MRGGAIHTLVDGRRKALLRKKGEDVCFDSQFDGVGVM